MTTTINPAIAEKLATEIGEAGLKQYADFMGLDSEVSNDIEDLTAEQLMEAAEITREEAETLLVAICIADEPSLHGAYQVLFNSY
jgi:hypothetical protein